MVIFCLNYKAKEISRIVGSQAYLSNNGTTRWHNITLWPRLLLARNLQLCIFRSFDFLLKKSKDKNPYQKIFKGVHSPFITFLPCRHVSNQGILKLYLNHKRQFGCTHALLVVPLRKMGWGGGRPICWARSTNYFTCQQQLSWQTLNLQNCSQKVTWRSLNILKRTSLSMQGSACPGLLECWKPKGPNISCGAGYRDTFPKITKSTRLIYSWLL